MKVLTDFHHTSLLRSLVLLFEDRLGMELYSPIGLEWRDRGYWAINEHPDTATQFLTLDQIYRPGDGTPPVNDTVAGGRADGLHLVVDPGGVSMHKACTFDYMINNRFDYVIASIPAHVGLFQDLIARYQPRAKLIVQMGNNWRLADYRGHNVLASIAPQPAPGVNVLFYHQEFDLNIFAPAPCLPTKRIHSYLHLITYFDAAWQDYQRVKRLLDLHDYEVRAYGGLCPDGHKTGPVEVADSMREAQFIFHVKPGGDGFGHVIHNTYAVGRPLITRASHYRGQLAERLLVSGTFIDLDRHGDRRLRRVITGLTDSPERLREMGERAAGRFREVVDYARDARAIADWLQTLP